MHAAPTAVLGSLPQDPIMGPVARLSQRRSYISPVQRLMAADPSTRDVAQRMANCATRLRLAIELAEQGDGRALITGGMFCQARLCPWCEWRRARVWRRRLIHGLGDFAEEHPKHRALFLTLTVRNCPVDNLGETLKEIHAGWRRLTNTKWFPTPFWLRRTEITLGRPSFQDSLPTAPVNPMAPLRGTTAHRVKPQGGSADRGLPAPPAKLWAHPHVHALLLVPPRYWGPDYISQKRWQEEWAMAARLDYSPVVDVRRAHAKNQGDGLVDETISATLEAAKYIAKSIDIEKLGERVPELHHQLRGVRMIATSHKLGKYVKREEPEDDELLDKGAVIVSPHPLLHCAADWDPLLMSYQLRPGA